MSFEKSDWRSVPTRSGSSFVRDVEFPTRGLKGRHTKTIYRAGHSGFEEYVWSPRAGVTRTLYASFDETGKLVQKNFDLGWTGKIKDPLALERPSLNPFEVANINLLGVGKTPGPDEIWSVTRRDERGNFVVDYSKQDGKISNVQYEPSATPFGIATNPQRLEELIRENPHGSIRALSTLYLEKGKGTFELIEKDNPSDRDVDLNQRGWTDKQKEHFNLALDEVLSAEVGFFDEQLTPEQQTQFISSLRRMAAGSFQSRRFVQAQGDYIRTRHFISEDLHRLISMTRQLHEHSSQSDVIPIFNFYDVKDDRLTVDVQDKESEDSLYEGDVPFGEDFRYDQFILNASRNGPKLLLAITQAARQTQRSWVHIQEEAPIEEVEKHIRRSRVENWINSVKFIPELFTDDVLSIVPEDEKGNPHGFLTKLAMDRKRKGTPEHQLAIKHIDRDCPHCQTRVFRLVSVFEKVGIFTPRKD